MAETLSNAELRDIEYQRAEDDEDIRALLAYVRHLKRKLGNAQKHIDEQRKHLNAMRLKRANIRFEDWEAEQMRDPEFRAAAEKLESAYQKARLRIIKKLKMANMAKDAKDAKDAISTDA